MTSTTPVSPRGAVRATRLLEREARIVGIRDFSSPTLEAVDRRRSQLWTVAFAGLVCLAAAVGLLTSGTTDHHIGFANRFGFRVGTVVLVVALGVYVMEKERHLRRLSRLLVDERVLSAALSNRLKELAMLYEAGKAMNSILVIDDVLGLILSSAFELLRATSGSILLLNTEGGLAEVCRAGQIDGTDSIEFVRSIAGRVARDREPLLVQGTVSEGGQLSRDSAVCVPLVHKNELLGVLILDGAPERPYTEYDVRAVSLFAEHAAIAVANARLYEAERQLSAKLSHTAVHDPLTGAANRVLVSDRLVHAMSRARRSGGMAAVLFIDIDDFKLVNDELGHEVGDDILAAFVSRLSTSVRPTDTVGRFGGDEFVVVCEDIGDEAQAVEIGNRIVEDLRRPFDTPFGDRVLSASVGVATCGAGNVVSADELIRNSDRAMYEAKMDGKARVVRARRRAA
ncbi:MAG: sensor domain-containing diguanylate cyclase [Acidimicrobiales bacterium]